MRRTRTAKGQSLVEMVLGLLVFVTVLIFGIHFAEVGFLSLKVQEAANSALWETTGVKMHDTAGPNWGLWQNGVAPAQARAQAMYTDFDAFANTGSTVTQVFTQATNLQVSCRAMNAGADQLDYLAPPPLAQAAFPAGDSGSLCSAEAVLEGIRIPRSFLDGEPFKAQHFNAVPLKVCATGRAVGGSCPGALALVLDDWGFSGRDEAQQCPLAVNGGAACDNQPYYDMARSVYDRSMGSFRYKGAASKLASLVAGASPIDEDFFYMSFRGNESPHGPFREDLTESHGDRVWETTPWEKPGRYKNPIRTNCWLGLTCL